MCTSYILKLLAKCGTDFVDKKFKLIKCTILPVVVYNSPRAFVIATCTKNIHILATNALFYGRDGTLIL